MLAVAEQRIRQGATATLQVTLLDQEGEPADAAGVVTVRVQRADGTDVLAAGTATSHEVAEVGIYTATLTAAQAADLDLLTATWTDAGDGSTHTTRHEIVGGYFFSVSAARAFDATALTEAKYPDPKVLEARREVEDEAERICGVAFVPRFVVERLPGTGTSRVVLGKPMVRSIRSVSIEWPGGTTDELDATSLAALEADDAGILERTTGAIWPAGTVIEVTYEHGYDRPPAELVRAALLRLRSRLALVNAGISDRTTSFTTDQGQTYRLDTAGRLKTGIPEVDATYARYSFLIR